MNEQGSSSLNDPKHWLNRITTAMVIGLLAVALLTFIVAPILANSWLKKPFIGGFVENTLVPNTTSPTKAGSWELRNNHLAYGYQVKAINQDPVTTLDEYYRVLSKYQVGDQVSIQILSPQGQLDTYPITLQKFPFRDQVSFFYIPYAIALVYFLSSLYVFGLRRRDATGKAFAIFTASVAIELMALFDIYTTNKLVYLWSFALALSGGALFNLALLFPEEDKIVTHFPFMRWLGYIPSLAIFLYAIPTLFNYARPLAYSKAWAVGYLYSGLSVFFFIGWMIFRRARSASPIVREQARLTLLGAAISFVPMAIWFLAQYLWTGISFRAELLLFLIFFPLFIAYTLARYRLLQTDFILSQLVLYGSLTFIVAVGYSLLVSGTALLFGDFMVSARPYLVGAIVFLLALLFNPLRERLLQIINDFFSRGSAAYREQLQNFGRELTEAMDLNAIVRLLKEYVNNNIRPFQLHIFVHDPLSDHYTATTDETGKATSDLHFSHNSSLVQSLSKDRSAMYLGENKTLPAHLLNDQARLGLLGSQLFVPLPGRDKLTGWICAASRQSGEPYTVRDLKFLESLGDQAALAIERAQVVSDLERRIHQMNILTRISQGINVTLAFDDILELIYAQTSHVIPIKDLRITLIDNASNYIYHVFYLENDDRLTEREGQPIPLGQDLEREVIRTRRPIITEDYERECRSRGTLPSTKGFFSWLGVPLNTGAETIGAISLGSRDPSVLFTNDQVNLLQAIADQAAGAIVKARLLEDAERRTRQLTTLNDVSRSMSSTLELSPLLNQIVKSAVEILNCDAGSLLLVDDETGDLVFEVAVAPVAVNLVGQRLPQGTGWVGKAIEARQAIIVNDVRRTKDWFDKTDDSTGFTTNDLLVVPMIFKDRVTGVIEVLNRRDGLPFSDDDKELLTAFTSQAAVALDNARLYTQTDQTLAARVEELSVLQRIDRELNASLDVNRAMRLTLDWAMRQSRSKAGLIGMIEEGGLLVMALQGYTNELANYAEGKLPLELPAVKASVETVQPQYLQIDDSNGGGGKTLLKGAHEQIAVPIRREAEVIGLILLENTAIAERSDELLAFLSRLSDHAAIAIANARLYAEVQAANQAKSDFVSFVSHELKTPMTSIRGFTDLLAAGVVGPVNENQTNFLATIRSNVDRMATLVTDLTDVSRIEAGRLRLDFAPIKVLDIVEEVVRSTRAQIDEKEQVLEMQIPEDLLPMWGDRMRIIQVLTNLVSNAYKYTPNQGNILIKAELADNIWTESPPKVIHLSVKDSGYGISPENQAKIFQKFFRADDQKVRDAPGTGLGLNITKQLVELQGGHIWFDSEFRQGTTFHFTVPIAETA